MAKENEKYKTGNEDFNDYHLNKNNFTVSAMITPVRAVRECSGWALSMILPLFEEGKGPDIHEAAVVFCFGLAAKN